MTAFHYEIDFKLKDESKFSDWIDRVIASENKKGDQIDFIFCDDFYLLNINLQYLNHDTFTDIITFDYSSEKAISGDIFISVDRVQENARTHQVEFYNELMRVMSHGVLHLMGYSDKSEDDVREMRSKEDEKIKLFHVEHL
ncbi:MAG: rRNA maturation RNase YbeY [Bacteroidota bacterium]